MGVVTLSICLTGLNKKTHNGGKGKKYSVKKTNERQHIYTYMVHIYISGIQGGKIVFMTSSFCLFVQNKSFQNRFLNLTFQPNLEQLFLANKNKYEHVCTSDYAGECHILCGRELQG